MLPLNNMSLNTAILAVSLFLFLFPVLIPKEKPPITVVGDVGGRIAIIVVRASCVCVVYLGNCISVFSCINYIVSVTGERTTERSREEAAAVSADVGG